MMAAERGASRNTLAAYRRDLEQAAEWVKGPLGDTDASALRKLMADYQPLAARSAARKLSALRQFFAFLLDEGERADNPAIGRASYRESVCQYGVVSGGAGTVKKKTK